LEKGNITYVVEEPTLSSDDSKNLARLKSILNEVLTLKASEMQSKQAAESFWLKNVLR